ncbi:hypothetical protein MPDQ_002274 [Monascus purpureus]|uniref:CENP-V/GFA domain-containing protein n=1 Tax=Monascus purpureus TaxID=5098 RepID=A0A507R379_MONPU|nr:hypothetical protein MPDQ_002274 [Monascus purpureus]BDD59990.1 hypothetical protein MAP00_005156 [Monascus purpureus]
MSQKSYTGSCLCGDIKYRIDLPSAEPPKVFLCHCTTCKRYTSSGFSANIIIPKPNCHYTKGSPKVYLGENDTGGIVRREFCGNCGASLLSKPSDDRGVIFVKSGTLDGEFREECRELGGEIYYHRKDGWVDGMKEEGVLRINGMPQDY